MRLTVTAWQLQISEDKMTNHDTYRVKLDDRCYRCECAECGTSFEATRSDASFCSARCRVAYSRRPALVAKTVRHIDSLGEQFWKYSTQYNRNKQIFEALQRLEKKLHTALANFEE